jgi:Bax protein
MNPRFERYSLLFLCGSVLVAAVMVLALLAGRTGAPGQSEAVPRSGAVSQGDSDGAGDNSSQATVHQQDYDLDAVAAGAPVPRAFGGNFDLGKVQDAGEKRARFIRHALPHVLLVNEEILSERSRLWAVRQKLRAGERLTPQERLWMASITGRYGVPADDLEGLTRRLDVIPPSVSLAVMAIDRRWRTDGATSKADRGDRLASAGDSSREDAAAGLEADPLLDAVRRSVHLLNASPAHEAFRQERERLRRQGTALSGRILAGTLPVRSTSGGPRGDAVRALIAAESLWRFDASRLETAGGA